MDCRIDCGVAAAHNVRSRATPPTLLARPEIVFMGGGMVTRVLISEMTNHLAADVLETREINSVLSVGETEPQRILELLGRKGEVPSERLTLRDAYVEALDAYRRKEWEKAIAGFEDCLAIVPCDTPSKLFLERIAQFRVTAPPAEWNGVWSLVEK
jgi:hypothetical protein